ncbi:hypothetical protein [Methylobacterium haplocladii]|uniref:DUF2157 domain-containing protein n=1 Tax=Methylobacterium haplocladii TaxID=1176176 RepID=A0A512IUI1_9HYPH|nr:hypothetical protein [Methylobacterium haplocladii]GEP01362.1 hypothetical protein MHA02_37490 [Methylobacterium haplocladii]GJD83836.1 hypothetical protein HPGCJGGD_1709 [Methylobacterium haplocladii]GLS58253.1 hypothetical protein GCM10007887_09110 [Methylobacterium haplocladii]
MTPGFPTASAEVFRDILARGVDTAIITQDQAERLAALAAGPEEPADDERLRFVTGFADVFVTFGVLLFLGAVHVLGGSMLGGGWSSALVAVFAWALAELFTRRRRMALPSIVLLLIFTVSCAYAAALAIAGTPSLPASLDREPVTVFGAAAVTVGLVALHYRRFGVPITIAAGTAALAAALVALAASIAPEPVAAHLPVIVAGAGLAVFALAMRFDLSDPARLTRRSDIAFWLHLLAAPLIVHPVLSALVAARSDMALDSNATASLSASGAQASVLGVVLLLSIVALVTDRRAILVSGLAYAGYTIGDLIRQIGLGNSALPLSLLVLGAFVLMLSAGWRPLRRAVLRLLPGDVSRRLPHPVGL